MLKIISETPKKALSISSFTLTAEDRVVASVVHQQKDGLPALLRKFADAIEKENRNINVYS